MSIIRGFLAVDQSGALGIEGHLPWDCPIDMGRFWSEVAGHAVLLGTETARTTGALFDKHRCAVFVVHSGDGGTHAVNQTVIEGSGLSWAVDDLEGVESVFRLIARIYRGLYVCGGGRVYESFLGMCDVVDLTLIHGSHYADVYFPSVSALFDKNRYIEHVVEARAECTFLRYVKRP